jgi:hypothetical protein
MAAKARGLIFASSNFSPRIGLQALPPISETRTQGLELTLLEILSAHAVQPCRALEGMKNPDPKNSTRKC